jgi:uncharacterized membrane protein YhhN
VSDGQVRSLVLIAAMAAGVAYVVSWAFHPPLPIEVGIKGAGVGLLALYAALCARTVDGWLLVAALALYAAGDVVIDAMTSVLGAVVFFLGHITATGLYLRNRGHTLTPLQIVAALVLVPVVIAISFMLAQDPKSATDLSIYSLAIALMAATAWTSRFPRNRTGIGALMFVVSNILIFARYGSLKHAVWVNLAIWIFYFGGQTLVTLGVTRTLRDAGPRPRIPAF